MDGEISPDEVSKLRSAESDVRIVDIRDAHSFQQGHIPDSENVPFHELARRIEAFEGDTRVITVCPHGKASVQAARLIGSYEGCADATVESMHGGLEAWAESYELVAAESNVEANADEEVVAASDGEGDAPF